MPSLLEDQLNTVQTRLGETLEVFALAKTINRFADPNVAPDANKAINRLGGFWQASLLAYQTTLFLGINAILDKESSDSATLYSVFRKINADTPGRLPADLESRLDAVRNRYKKFRHKLFGHNDKNRQKFVDQFNSAGFTWPGLESDLEELEYAFKVLFEAMRGRPIPPEERAKEMRFPYSAYVLRAESHTMQLISELQVDPPA